MDNKEEKSNSVKITEARGQYRITYPKKIAHAQDIRGGMLLAQQIKGGELVLVKVSEKKGLSNVVKVAETKYQVRFTLIKSIAHAFGMKKGDCVAFEYYMGNIVLRKVIS